MNRRLVVMYVQDYLRGERSLTDLQERLMALLWGDRAAQPADTIELAMAIDLRIAEFTGGYISREALAEAMRDVAGLSIPVVTNDLSPPDLEWESSIQTRQQEAALA